MTHAVLLVDDDPDILDSLKMVLEHAVEDVHVHTAPSGAAALEILRDTRVQLIITDYQMPGMTGAEFLAQADAIARETPRIMISAFSEATVREDVEKRTRVDLIMGKPMDVDELIGRTRRLLAR